jgi:DNA repair protein RecN (Recombination protein N)
VEFVNESVEALYSDENAVMVRLHQVLQRGTELGAVDSELTDRLKSLNEAKALIEDATYELREYGKDLEADPEELDRIQERLANLRKLQKKFGQTAEEILQAHQDMLKEVSSLEKSEESLASLEAEVMKLTKMLGLMAKELHSRRLKGAGGLEKKVNDELSDLNMKGVIFSVHSGWLEHFQSHGQSDIEFMIQVSKKDEPKPMAKVASGGELSRILLALKRVVGSADRPHTYLFDEVDTGVSGQTAEKVGRKLKSIAKNQQLICVTHLAQVASFADRHFLIEKRAQKGGGMKMEVEELAKEDRVKEIARLISGEKITPTSLTHARALISESR